MIENREDLGRQFIVFHPAAGPAGDDLQLSVLLDLEAGISRNLRTLEVIFDRLVQHRSVEDRFVVVLHNREGQCITDNFGGNLRNRGARRHLDRARDGRESERVRGIRVRHRHRRLFDDHRQVLLFPRFQNRRHDCGAGRFFVDASSLLPRCVLHGRSLDRERRLHGKGGDESIERSHLTVEFVLFDDDHRLDINTLTGEEAREGIQVSSNERLHGFHRVDPHSRLTRLDDDHLAVVIELERFRGRLGYLLTHLHDSLVARQPPDIDTVNRCICRDGGPATGDERGCAYSHRHDGGNRNSSQDPMLSCGSPPTAMRLRHGPLVSPAHGRPRKGSHAADIGPANCPDGKHADPCIPNRSARRLPPDCGLSRRIGIIESTTVLRPSTG